MNPYNSKRGSIKKRKNKQIPVPDVLPKCLTWLSIRATGITAAMKLRTAMPPALMELFVPVAVTNENETVNRMVMVMPKRSDSRLEL